MNKNKVKLRINHLILLLFLIPLLLAMGGCWDLREINELGLVTAVAIDRAETEEEEGSKYSITVQIANPSTEGTGGGSEKSDGSAGKEVWTGTAEGDTLFQAVRQLVAISSRRIMWAHNSVVVIGESLARDSIVPVIDFFTHNPELRLNAVVVVAEGDAKEYLDAKAGMDSPSGVSFVRLTDYLRLTAESIDSTMLNVNASLRNALGNPLIAAVHLKEETSQKEESGKGEEKAKIIGLMGAAVFDREKMAGWLTAEEALGVSWILGKTKNIIVSVPSSYHDGKYVALEIRKAKTVIKSHITDGIPEIMIKIKCSGEIVEEDYFTDASWKDIKENIKEEVKNKIIETVNGSLEIIQNEYKTDVLGFAKIVHAQNKKEWNAGLKDRWKEIFPDLNVNVEVDVHLMSSALNQDPMMVYD